MPAADGLCPSARKNNTRVLYGVHEDDDDDAARVYYKYDIFMYCTRTGRFPHSSVHAAYTHRAHAVYNNDNININNNNNVYTRVS